MPYNPVSRQNLQPRETVYQEPKKRHEITVTPSGWSGFKEVAAGLGMSASELVERLGRRSLTLQDAMGEEPQGDTLTVTSWSIETGKAVDSSGRRYLVKRVKDTP